MFVVDTCGKADYMKGMIIAFIAGTWKYVVVTSLIKGKQTDVTMITMLYLSTEMMAVQC